MLQDCIMNGTQQIDKWGNVRVPNSLIKQVSNYIETYTTFTSVSDFVVDSIRRGLREKLVSDGGHE